MGVKGHERKPKHLLIVTSLFMGHYRSISCLAAALVQANSDILITFMSHHSIIDRIKGFIASYHLNEEQQKRLRIVGLLESVPLLPGESYQIGVATSKFVMEELWETISSGQPFCGLEAAPPPGAIISDTTNEVILEHAHSRKTPAKRYVAVIGFTSAFLQFFESWTTSSDTIGGGKDRPTYYTDELGQFAKLPWDNSKFGEMIKQIAEVDLSGRHTILSVFSRRLLPLGAADDINLFEVGAQWPPSVWQPTAPLDLEANVSAFLGRHAVKSVLYISYGSLFFPAACPWMPDVLVDSLIAAGIPFIFVWTDRASSFFPDNGAAVKAKIKESNNLVVPWTNQQELFKHSAIGWTLTHGGYNTCMESLIQGIPLVVWPMGAEQAQNAGTLTLTLDVAFELLQTRDNLVGKQLYNYPDVDIQATPQAVRAELDHVWRRTQGEEGQRKRANAQKMAQALRDEHEMAAEAYLKEFLETFA